jgi:hypothetical protein
MEADDVTSAQELIEPDPFDRHIIYPVNMPFETKYMAAKGIAQSRDLQPDGATSDNP